MSLLGRSPHEYLFKQYTEGRVDTYIIYMKNHHSND